ncbi:glycoside hydrolase family 65 protein [Apilactobacillus bombintestini]|uniref:Glycoside hydrolase family 65 protein n=1 Tax=Apilactobacillus bombintestini TaxID=2419772 RepID=A0A387AS85_9LACO|nr:glycosyl hydrolase family 65 protein [Apilactobacillus bombintestini]AYF92241.1 glycoside hydrolase family 65 protein [Apilactobacillus bombintestini]
MMKEIKLRLTDVNACNISNLESIFSLANGHVGIRATNPITSDSLAGTLVNGYFEYSPIVYGEVAANYPKRNETIVSLPNLRKIKVMDEKHREFKSARLVDINLDLLSGQLSETYELWNVDKQQINMQVTSYIDQEDVQFFGIQYTFIPISYSSYIYVDKRFSLDEDAQHKIAMKIDDPRKTRKIASIQRQIVTKTRYRQTIMVDTAESNQKIYLTVYSYKNDQPLLSKLTLNKSQTVTYQYNVSQKNTLLDKRQIDWDLIKSHSIEFWQQVWQNSEVSITGNDELNLALHFNIFQLNQSTGRDGKTNIAAKGLSGPGYEGHTFWDTEMYMISYYIYSQPEIAKKLLMYRYNTLDFARNRARQLGVNEGALFAWRSINGEETSAYYPASTAAYHLDGDIAYAIGNYYEATHDDDFLAQYGFEMLLETARFWRRFGCWVNKRDYQQFEFHTVTGPDEYTVMVDNNYFTNRMAQHNLRLAYRLGKRLSEINPRRFAKFNVSTEEMDDFVKIADHIYFPFSDKFQINAQDDTFFSKAIWPFSHTPRDKYPLLLHYHPLTIYRYQVNKQADTLLADLLFPETITAEQLKREYDYYESITTHDSSLSRSIFSTLAARMGYMNKAYDYFLDTVRMDLTDLQGNTEDGLHLANLGGSWMSVVQGFAGMQVTPQGVLKLIPHLPKEWEGFNFRMVFHNRLLNINISGNQTTISLLDGKPMNVLVNDKSYHLEKILKILTKR